MTTPYQDKLRDPRWQKKRLEILQAADFACEDCGCRDQELHVHHACYIKDREPWEYDRNLLIALCDECHKWRHEFEQVCKVYLSVILRYSSIDTIRNWAEMLSSTAKSNAKYDHTIRKSTNENP